MANTEEKVVTGKDNKQQFKDFLGDAKRFSATYIRFIKKLDQTLDAIGAGKVKLQSKTKSEAFITGILLSKVITKTDGELEYSAIITDYSLPGSIKSMEVETILGFSVGIGFVKYEDGRTFYGFINLQTKLPTLAGIWNDNDGENLKLEYGLEYGESLWSNTPRTLDDIMLFFIECVEKDLLERSICEKWLFPVFAAKKNVDEIHNTAEKLAKVTLKDTLLTAVDYTDFLNQFDISIDQFPQGDQHLTFKLGNNGSHIVLLEDHLSDFVQTSARYFTSTGQYIYPIDILSTILVPNTPPNSDIYKSLVQSEMVRSSDRVFVNGLGNLSKLDVFVQENDSLELRKLEHVEFSIHLSSPTGKSSYEINTKTQYQDFIVKARRWDYHYVDVFLVGDVKSSMILSIHSNQVTQDTINRLYGTTT